MRCSRRRCARPRPMKRPAAVTTSPIPHGSAAPTCSSRCTSCSGRRRRTRRPTRAPSSGPRPRWRRCRQNPDRFESLARAVSDCPSASEGGRLGQVTRGDTTGEFEAALLSLEAGQTCPEPVRTRYGVHVVRLERRIAGKTLPVRAGARAHRRLSRGQYMAARGRAIHRVAGGPGQDSGPGTWRGHRRPWCNRRQACWGEILQGLSDPARAEEFLAVVGKPEVRTRIERAAGGGGGCRRRPRGRQGSPTLSTTEARRSGWT